MQALKAKDSQSKGTWMNQVKRERPGDIGPFARTLFGLVFLCVLALELLLLYKFFTKPPGPSLPYILALIAIHLCTFFTGNAAYTGNIHGFKD